MSIESSAPPVNPYSDTLKGYLNFIRTGWFSALAKILLCLFILFYILYALKSNKQETPHTEAYITHPKVGDIYFIDYQRMTVNARPTQRYRIGKLVDITGDILTLQYSNLFYMNHRAMELSIHYGQLRYPKYLESKRYDYPISDVKDLVMNKTIYSIQRPEHGRLYGNFTEPTKRKINNKQYLPGKAEYNQGIGFLNAPQYEDNLEFAFKKFSASAHLNYAPGQVNLAEMYLTGQFVDKDLSQTLFWLKQASLQSHKPAILKYVIVCGQVEHCNEAKFYQELLAAGVNIKVRALSNDIAI